MSFNDIARWTLLLLASTAIAYPAPGQQHEVEVGIRHQLECPISGELEATVYIYNRSDKEQFYLGEVAAEDGSLLLSGDWRLILEEVKNGEIVWSKRLEAHAHEAAQRRTLAPNSDRHWKARIPVRELVAHAGNYRLRVSHASHTRAGRVFRIVDRRGAPEWVSLTYAPDKKSYLLGEAITVHFEMKNNGMDEFHFEEGGDYRGATRHLRWAFTAENEQGQRAVDPRPSQSCLGGLGMADPHLKPGKTYEKDLPLLAYLRFPAPGCYQVKCYQSLGFGEPVEEIGAGGYWGDYAFGGQFEIELRLPTEEEATRLLREALTGPGENRKRRGNFSSLYHPCFLKPLQTLLASESDEERIEALVTGIGSVTTVDSTRELIALASDARAQVRVTALRHLSWRLPDPRDTGEASHDSPFRLYSQVARRQDVEASWDESLREPLREVLLEGLEASSLDEVSVCAYALGALGDTGSIDRLAATADRLAPTLPVADSHATCVNQIASAASVLAQLGAEPCSADKDSSPGRLAVWANMVRTKASYRTGDWEELILHMMFLDCPTTRMAAIRWLPRDFSLRHRIPWKKLFLEKNDQIWWHAIQVARRAFPSDLGSIAEEVLAGSTDAHKQREFRSLIEEIDERSRR